MNAPIADPDLVFPIGHYVGVHHPGGTHAVRIAREHVTMSEDEFGLWVLAHGTLEAGAGRWTIGDVLAQADTARLPDARAGIERLVAVGALAAVPDDAMAFAEAHRMSPLLVGIGNSEAEPDQYRVGLPAPGPSATLGQDAYELWQWGHLTPSLWDACEVRAEVYSGLGRPVRARDLLDEVLGDLRTLLARDCAYLDRAGLE